MLRRRHERIVKHKERERLRCRHRSEKDGRTKDRIKDVLLSDKGISEKFKQVVYFPCVFSKMRIAAKIRFLISFGFMNNVRYFWK